MAVQDLSKDFIWHLPLSGNRSHIGGMTPAAKVR